MISQGRQTRFVIDPAEHVVDLTRREVDAIRRSASEVLTSGRQLEDASRIGVQAAAGALRRIERSYPVAVSKAPIDASGTRDAMIAAIVDVVDGASDAQSAADRRGRRSW